MKRLFKRWQRWRAGAPQRKLDRAISGLHRDTEWLQKRPFSDQYDGDGWKSDSTRAQWDRRRG